MTTQEAIVQAFENGRRQGYEEGKRDAVKHGRWIREGNRNTCPECGFFYHSAHADYDYCPHCGMKMDGEDHGKRKAVD